MQNSNSERQQTGNAQELADGEIPQEAIPYAIPGLFFVGPEPASSFHNPTSYSYKRVDEEVGEEVMTGEYAPFQPAYCCEQDFASVVGHLQTDLISQSMDLEAAKYAVQDAFHKTDESETFSKAFGHPVDLALSSDEEVRCDEREGEGSSPRGIAASVPASMLHHHCQRSQPSHTSGWTHQKTRIAMIQETSIGDADSIRGFDEQNLDQDAMLEAQEGSIFRDKRPDAVGPPLRGVCEYPSFNLPSFMMAGDSGVVRWVTASGLKKSPRHRAYRRWGRFETSGSNDVNFHGSLFTNLDPPEGHMHNDESMASDEDDASVDAIPTSKINLPLGAGLVTASRGGTVHNSLGFSAGTTPVRDFLRQISDQTAQATQLEQSSTELAASLIGVASQDEIFLSHHASTAPGRSVYQDELWVTKYAPRHFREVLSDESINLRLLRWLKSWDGYVFQGDGKLKDTDPFRVTTTLEAGHVVSLPSSSSALSSGIQKVRKESGGGGRTGENTSADDNKGYTRGAEDKPVPPADRIAFLVGSPGVGKTTLAHILAAHCGYEVVEVNASMERTYAQLEALIRMTVSSPGPALTRVCRRKRPRPLDDVGPAGGGAPSVLGVSSSLLAPASMPSSTSVIDLLLTPKCLIIDEIDGMATSVAQLLLSLDICRPVLCMCNDFYAPSLRPLRRRCQNVFFIPPIAPQRLLSRLLEISQKEGLAIDQTVLAELVRSSNGDVRSCLNTLQLINRMPAATVAASTAGSESVQHPHSARISTMQMIRQIQGKDSPMNLWESWRLVFSKLDRIRAIERLKEYNIHYEELMFEASVNRPGILPRSRAGTEQTSSSRATTRLTPSNDCTSSTTATMLASARENDRKCFFSAPKTLPKTPFRFDPGYIHLACLLREHGGSLLGNHTFIDGLHENFLGQEYSDYSLEHTTSISHAFALQNVFSSRSFAHNAPSAIDFASKFEAVTALTCYVHCGKQCRRDPRTVQVNYPREQAQSQQLSNASLSTIHSFRDGCRSLEVVNHLWSTENVAADICPFLLRSLFDRRLRLYSYAMRDLSTLPNPDQRYHQAAVQRHVTYGLTYHKQVHPFLSFPGTPFRFTKPSDTTFQLSNEHHSQENVQDTETMRLEETWCLTPPIDHVGGFRRHFAPAMSAVFASHTRSTHTSSTTSNAGNGYSEGCIFMAMKDEIRQIMAGEIERYTIMLMSKATTSGASSKQGEAQNSILNGEGSGKNTVHDMQSATHKPSIHALCEGKEASKTMCDRLLLSKKGLPEEEYAASMKSTSPAEAVTDVKRDFFGRIVPTAPSSTSGTFKQSKTNTPVSPMTSHRVPPKPPVRYVYHDGSTNAVKFPATINDF